MQSIVETVRIMHGRSPLASLLYEHVLNVTNDEGTMQEDLICQLKMLTVEGQTLLENLDSESADSLMGALSESAETNSAAGLLLEQLFSDVETGINEHASQLQGDTDRLTRVPSAAGRKALEELVAQGSELLMKVEADEANRIVRSIQSTAEIAPLASALYRRLLDDGSDGDGTSELALQAVLMSMRQGLHVGDAPRIDQPGLEKALKAMVATAIATGQVARQAHESACSASIYTDRMFGNGRKYNEEPKFPSSSKLFGGEREYSSGRISPLSPTRRVEEARIANGPNRADPSATKKEPEQALLCTSPGMERAQGFLMGDLDISRNRPRQSSIRADVILSTPAKVQDAKVGHAGVIGGHSSVLARSEKNRMIDQSMEQRTCNQERLQNEISYTGAPLLAPLGERAHGMALVKKTSKLKVHERRLQVIVILGQHKCSAVNSLN